VGRNDRSAEGVKLAATELIFTRKTARRARGRCITDRLNGRHDPQNKRPKPRDSTFKRSEFGGQEPEFADRRRPTRSRQPDVASGVTAGAGTFTFIEYAGQTIGDDKKLADPDSAMSRLQTIGESATCMFVGTNAWPSDTTAAANVNGLQNANAIGFSV